MHLNHVFIIKLSANPHQIGNTHVFYIGSMFAKLDLLGVFEMEEVLCNVELVKENNDFVIKIQSDLGGVREYRSMNFEEVLEQLMQDLQEEFESL